MIFDEGIISDLTSYDNFLKTNFSPPLSNANFSSVKSHESTLIQLADVAAGFNRLVTDICLGHPNKQIEVLDDGPGLPIKMDLRSYICLSQRWNIWGEVPPPPDPETSPLMDAGHSSTWVVMVFESCRQSRLILLERFTTQEWSTWDACINFLHVRGALCAEMAHGHLKVSR
jgi:hypothetical protein